MRPIPTACAVLALLASLLDARGAPDREAKGSSPVVEALGTLSGHTRRVRCLQFAPDGRLASGGADRLVNLWSAEGTLVRSIDLRPGGG